MTPLDLSPAPAAAPAARRVLSHALCEARLLARNGEQLLLALVIPVGILVLGRTLGGPFGGIDVLAPSVLGVAIWSSAFTSVAIATGFERRYGVLERLASTPLGRSGLIAGKCVAVLLVVAGQLLVLVAVGLVLGWRPAFTAGSAATSLLAAALAVAVFVSLGLLLAGRLRAEATLGLANLVYLMLLAGGGLVVPVASYPAAMQPVVAALPTAALGEGLRFGAQAGLPTGASEAILWWPLVVLAAWLAVAAVAAWKGFRWTS